MRFMFRIFLIDSPLVGLGELNIYQNLVDLTRSGDFTWRVPDCEELLVVTHTGDDGGVVKV